MTERTLLTGLGVGESPRWHDGRLWLANWGTAQVLALNPDGSTEVTARVPTTIPYSIDWLRDGRLLAVSGQQARLLRQETDGSLTTYADLSALSSVFNELVVDGRGNAYVDGSVIALVRPDGSVTQVADDLAFGNGMAVTADNSTLIVAESHGNRLTAFDIAADGTLADRRLWADLDGGYPDGLCLDAEAAAGYADVPKKRCVRVRAGGEVLQRINLDRGAFACMLGGAHGRTLSCSRRSGAGWSTSTMAIAPASCMRLTSTFRARAGRERAGQTLSFSIRSGLGQRTSVAQPNFSNSQMTRADSSS